MTGKSILTAYKNLSDEALESLIASSSLDPAAGNTFKLASLERDLRERAKSRKHESGTRRISVFALVLSGLTGIGTLAWNVAVTKGKLRDARELLVAEQRSRQRWEDSASHLQDQLVIRDEAVTARDSSVQARDLQIADLKKAKDGQQDVLARCMADLEKASRPAPAEINLIPFIREPTKEVESANYRTFILTTTRETSRATFRFFCTAPIAQLDVNFLAMATSTVGGASRLANNLFQVDVSGSPGWSAKTPLVLTVATVGPGGTCGMVR